MVEVRAKSSRGRKKHGARAFTVRVRDLAGREDLIEFENADYQDFELRSRDLAAFTFLNDQLTVVQNLTVGRYMKISRAGCYIATCVYGARSAEVIALRQWRDDVLLPSTLGAWLVSVYYGLSPALVQHFGNNRLFRRVCRAALQRLLRAVR